MGKDAERTKKFYEKIKMNYYGYRTNLSIARLAIENENWEDANNALFLATKFKQELDACKKDFPIEYEIIMELL